MLRRSGGAKQAKKNLALVNYLLDTKQTLQELKAKLDKVILHQEPFNSS